MTADERDNPRQRATWPPDYVRDLSEKVYRERLGAADVASMIEKDKDGGEKLRNRAGAYDPLTRAYLEVLWNIWSHRNNAMDEARIKELIEKQANDEGCWFVAQTCAEAYLQRQLRLLHAAIEGTDFFGIPLTNGKSDD